MPMKLLRDKLLTNEQNISYYDEIADNYNNILDQKNSNKIIRQRVADKFQDIVKEGLILDFGGGTGLDLKWLMDKGYQVIFCEPSAGMREKAIKHIRDGLINPSIIFLDDTRADFTGWQAELPFFQKVDSILANFAVLNNIADIKLLFKTLALVIKPGGHLIALILNDSFKKSVKSRWIGNLRSLIFGTPFSFYVQHKKNRQTVFIYTIKEIQKASTADFQFFSQELFHPSGFSLIHLVRK
jgi:SAM-dependent methyltransferase